jgi:AcrR family transcriptional regulator
VPQTTAPDVDRRSRRHHETRSEILAAAWSLAEDAGLAGISLRDVAARVGMRAPSLYTYFPSKAAIYDAMFVDAFTQFDEELDAAAPVDPAAPVEALTRALEAFVSFCQASVPRYHLMFTRALPDWEPSPEAYARSVVSYERMVADLASIGVTDPGTIDLYTAAAAGLAAQQVANDLGGDRWLGLARDAAEMLHDHARRRT